MTAQLQLLHNLPLSSLYLWTLQPVLQLHGSYHQKAPDMESSKDINCSMKRKVQVLQPSWLLAMKKHQQELSSLINTPNMNFKCWPSPLLVMDQTVLLFSGQQWKMVRTDNAFTKICINCTIMSIIVEIKVILLIDLGCCLSNVDSGLK